MYEQQPSEHRPVQISRRMPMLAQGLLSNPNEESHIDPIPDRPIFEEFNGKKLEENKESNDTICTEAAIDKSSENEKNALIIPIEKNKEEKSKSEEESDSKKEFEKKGDPLNTSTSDEEKVIDITLENENKDEKTENEITDETQKAENISSNEIPENVSFDLSSESECGSSREDDIENNDEENKKSEKSEMGSSDEGCKEPITENAPTESKLKEEVEIEMEEKDNQKAENLTASMEQAGAHLDSSSSSSSKSEEERGQPKTQENSSLSASDLSEITSSRNNSPRLAPVSPLDLTKVNQKKPGQVVTPKIQSASQTKRSEVSSRPPAVRHDNTFVTGYDNVTLYSEESKPPPNPEVVEEALDKLMKEGKQPSEELREPVLQLINRKKVQALFDSDYDAAEAYDNAVSLCNQYNAERSMAIAEERRNRMIDNRNFMLREEARVMEEKWDEKISKHKKECEERMNQLEERHKIEVADFKQRWQDPEYIRQFNKPSTRLLQLRHQEKKMALSRQYHQAKETKAIADALQAQEEQEAQLNIERKMRADFIKLRERQQRDIDKLNDYTQKTTTDMEVLRKREMMPYENAIKSIGAKRETRPNKRFSTLPPSLRQSTGTSDGYSSTMQTPRTLSRFNKYRIEKRGELNLTPVDDATFSRVANTKTWRGTAPNSRLASRQNSQKSSPTKLPKF